MDARILVSNLSDTFVQDISEKFPPGKVVIGRCASTSNLTRSHFSCALGNLWCSFLQISTHFKTRKTCIDNLEKVVAYCGFVESNISKVSDLTQLFEFQDFECGYSIKPSRNDSEERRWFKKINNQCIRSAI